MQHLHKLADLKKYSLLASDGEIGKIIEVYFDDAQWALRYFVVRTGGWLLGREVLIAPRAIAGLDEEAGQLQLDLTREQVEKSPPVETQEPVSRHYETLYYQYYNWDPYWMAGPMGGSMSAAPRTVLRPQIGRAREPENPHLRASGEVHGYRLQAIDGELGEVHDLIIDVRDWKVRYLVADTRKWLPGKKVLLAPAWVEGIDWVEREITADLERETIRSAPPYDPSRAIGADYEVRLLGHYGKATHKEEV
ncbi:MAG: PRC-barrel domain-containing protein [Burkholderiales bacterium]|nr:PRC-barrel domain-containing protein [Burkholderiales bacterium]